QRVEAIGTLAGGIAHDFNNILTPIMIHSEMALKKATALPFPDLAPHLEKVLKAGHRAVNLISQILSFSRREEQERKPIQIEPIIKETLKLLRATLPSTIEIRQNIAPNAGIIMGDPGQLHQVLMNLCTNAKHAMREEEGVLEVRLEGIPVDSEKSRRLSGLPAGEYIKLTVRDTGRGIENDLMDKIFEPYFTTKKKGEGTGLGLTMVQGIVTSLGGAVTVESEPGVGTAFHVYFPLFKGELWKAKNNKTGLAGGAERILFVDDEKPTVDSIGEFLTYLGYEIIGKTSSLEALETFRADPDGFDLVITDQTMPKMTGGELARKILKIRPDTAIILCTGYSDVMDEHGARILGVRKFIMKPFVTDAFSSTIRKVLDERKKPRRDPF
ncbi:MAG: response regulator, partial [Desulfobacterales bacterium]|nr:response regulator [Desulfobacterales bacterium]